VSVVEAPSKFGLALSGGGFRATLFHLGVLRYLYDRGVLGQVEHVSSVSGGSVVAAHLALRWEVANTDFERFAKPLLKLVQSDVRGRIVRRWPLISAVNWMPGLRWLTSTYLLERYYSRELYAGAEISALRGVSGTPVVHLLATSLSYPDYPAAFCADGFFNLREGGVIETGRPPVALAVAASSALPVAFPPIRVNARMLRVREKQMLYPQQYLTDGGVYDNLGLRSLRIASPDGDARTLIVSDAGATSDSAPQKSFRRMTSALGRVTEILFDRIRRLEKDSADDADAATKRNCHVSIHETFKDPPIAWFTTDVQRTLAVIRTDLDSFTSDEIRALVMHGQLAAARRMHATLGVNAPNDHRLWDPLPGGAAITASSLDDSSRRAVRFFAKDKIHVLYGILILLAVLSVWGVLRPAPYEVLHTTIAHAPSRFATSNPGFTIQKRSVLIDLTHEKTIAGSLRDAIRLSPSIHDYTLLASKDETNPRYLVYEVISQRKLNEAFCTSGHPYEVRYRRQEGIAGAGLDHVLMIIIDTAQHLPNSAFNVSFRAIRYNAYQADNTNWVGVRVDDHEELVETTVLLPTGKVLRSTPEVKLKVRGSDEAETAYTGDSEILIPDDRASFTWRLSKPVPDFIYKAYVDWGM
jgi:predicted acylesterase/phospholipase RssA